MAAKMRRRISGLGLKTVDTGVVVSSVARFACGDDCALYHGTYILNTHGRVTFGNHSHMGAFCYANVLYGHLSIGDHVAIGPGCRLIVYSNHYGADTLVTEMRLEEDIVIGNNVFIGANSVILPGTIIEDHVVIGAGSVVKGQLTANAVYAGAPCRKIKDGWYR